MEEALVVESMEEALVVEALVFRGSVVSIIIWSVPTSPLSPWSKPTKQTNRQHSRPTPIPATKRLVVCAPLLPRGHVVLDDTIILHPEHATVEADTVQHNEAACVHVQIGHDLLVVGEHLGDGV